MNNEYFCRLGHIFALFSKKSRARLRIRNIYINFAADFA